MTNIVSWHVSSLQQLTVPIARNNPVQYIAGTGAYPMTYQVAAQFYVFACKFVVFSATTRLALVRFFANDYPNLSRNTHVVPND